MPCTSALLEAGGRKDALQASYADDHPLTTEVMEAWKTRFEEHGSAWAIELELGGVVQGTVAFISKVLAVTTVSFACDRNAETLLFSSISFLKGLSWASR